MTPLTTNKGMRSDNPQTLDSCPKIEWLKFINSTENRLLIG